MKMISRRDFMKASAVVGAAGVLTACGGSSSSTAASSVAASSAAASEAATGSANVGVCIYQFADNFMTLYRTDLEEYLKDKGYAVTIVDGKNDQNTQTEQINTFLQYRTEYSIKALTDAGKEVECLYEYLDNWDQTTAQQDVANALAQYGEKIEVVFCNNDAMALGALQSIEQAGRTVGKDIYLVGVDALKEAVQNVVDGKMTGTVLNDDVGQATAAAEATQLFVEGKDVEEYYWVDYVKVTTENAAQYL